MDNMLDAVMGSMGGNELGMLSSLLGSDNEMVQKGVAAAIPAILGGLAANTKQQSGTESLFNALNKDHDGSILDNLGGFLGQGESPDGAGILGHIFGDKRPQVEQTVAQQSGLPSGLIAKLLPMLAPIIMGYLGRKMREGALDTGGLGGLVQGEAKSTGASSIPGLEDILGGVLSGGQARQQQPQQQQPQQQQGGGGLLGSILGRILGRR